VIAKKEEGKLVWMDVLTDIVPKGPRKIPEGFDD
jgi:hypothetical protein